MKYIKTYEIRKINPNFSKLQMENKFINAAAKGSNSAVKKFIKQGININARGDDDRTALSEATAGSYIMVVDTLINAGVDVNLRHANDETALMVAKTQKIIDKLLNAGADVNIVNNNGSSAIMGYLYYHNKVLTIPILEKFLERGLDLDIKDNYGDNFYDLLKDFQKNVASDRKKYYQNIVEYVDEKFPQYKDEWEMKQNVNKYNL